MKEYLDSGKVKNWKEQEDGSLVVWVRISKEGTLNYGDVTEYVDSETLFNTASLESLVGVPALLEHPPTVFIRNLKQRQTYQKGCTLQEVIKEKLDDGTEALTVASVIFDDDLKKRIISGDIKEVSAAYRADSKDIEGKLTQRGRLYNHIAFTAAGRAGKDVKVLLNEESNMADKTDSAATAEAPVKVEPAPTPEDIRKQLVAEIKEANSLLKKFNSDIAYTPGDDLLKLKRAILNKVTGKDSSKYSEAELNIALDVLPEYKAPEPPPESKAETKTEPDSEKTDSVVAVEPKVDTYYSVNAADGFPANVIRSAEIAKAQAEQAKRIGEAWKIGLPPEIAANY